MIVLSHMADVVREASRRGFPVVLAGHTHGGQVRLPFVGALTTRSSLGAFYDRGRFEFAAPNDRGLTTLYINPGSGCPCCRSASIARRDGRWWSWEISSRRPR